MRSALSRFSIVLLISALVGVAGCATDDDFADDVVAIEEAELVTADSPAAAIDLNLRVFIERLGCRFGVAQYLFTARATGGASYKWFAKNWDGSWILASTDNPYFWSGTPPRKYFKIEACIAAGCDSKEFSLMPVCAPAP